MNITSEQLEQEKKYLKKTLKVIQSLIDQSDSTIQYRMNSINELKRYIWENNAVLDDMEIATGMYHVNTDVGYTNESIRQFQKLKKSLMNPYFGRVDFENDGDTSAIYIGINGIMKDLDFYVFDWRSPVASLFYNYGIGKASYEAPSGQIDGKLTLKRQYKIVGNKIERCFDSDINIDDEYLQEILSNSSSDKMTNIVNTIQREQNEIIRNITDRFLIVQGIAGSGKTSVALHRIAYLLYKEKNLTSNNVLIFSPNDVFSEYISDVLPGLGEDNVLQSTFSDFASSYIKDYKEIESFTAFLERFYKDGKVDEESFKVTKYKLSDEFKSYLDNYIEKLRLSIHFSKGIIINNKEITKEELNRLLIDRFSRFPFLKRIDSISEYLCDLNHISYKKYGKKLSEKLRDLLNDDLNIMSIYSKILSSEDFKTNAGIISFSSFQAGRVLKYEDLLPVMYLYFELNGYPNGNAIRHIIIDEAQDYSLLQFHMLKKIFHKASFTILGDIHQTINPYYIYNNLNEINSIFDNNGRYIELTKTYRSSEEIIDFTNHILGINNACSVRRSNSIPVVFRDVEREQAIEQLVIDINQMKENGMKRIAIITKNNAETIDLYESLKEQFSSINLIDGDGKKEISDLVILPSYVSKGLEFDGVIAYSDKKHVYQEKDRYLFYVVCTRAQHSLTVYNQKKLVLQREK